MKKRLIAYIIIIIVIMFLGMMFYYKQNEDKQYTTKEDIMFLLDKGLKASTRVKIWIYSRESLSAEYVQIYEKGKYKDLIDIVDFKKYNNERFEYYPLKSTEDVVYGYFSEKENTVSGNTYIRIDKKSGRLLSLENNLYAVVFS